MGQKKNKVINNRINANPFPTGVWQGWKGAFLVFLGCFFLRVVSGGFLALFRRVFVGVGGWLPIGFFGCFYLLVF